MVEREKYLVHLKPILVNAVDAEDALELANYMLFHGYEPKVDEAKKIDV